MLRCVALIAALVACSGQATLGSTWPAEPVGVAETLRVQAEGVQGRMLGEEAPSGDAIAEYNILLFSSIGMVVVFYFAAAALMNMDVTNDSLLYSKSKTD